MDDQAECTPASLAAVDRQAVLCRGETRLDALLGSSADAP